MLHWTIWCREPGFHEASLRRYGSKLVYHITVYFLFTLLTVTCKYSTLTQLTYHFAPYNSCSNWRLLTSMQAWNRRTRFCRTLTNMPGVFWITGFTDPRFPTSKYSVEHPLCAVQFLHALTKSSVYIYRVSQKHRQHLVAYIVQDGKLIIFEDGNPGRNRTVWAL